LDFKQELCEGVEAKDIGIKVIIGEPKMFEKGGTCCPTCGTRQAHIHPGWLKLEKLQNRIEGRVLFTQVNCKECGWISLIVRFNQEMEEIRKVERAVREAF